MPDLSFILSHAWLIPALPLASFLLVGLFLRPWHKPLAGAVATASVFTSAGLSWWLAVDYLQLPKTAGGALPAITPFSVEWLRFQEGLSVHLGTLLDPISVMLLVVVTTVSALVHLYSLGYLKGEDGFGRYFAFLNLFTFSMLGLVLASNLVQMYVCWELVGASSFFLIGYYYDRPSAVAASKKAFIVTRFADLGFLLGILVLGYYSFEIHAGMGAAAQGQQALDFAFLTRPDVLAQLQALQGQFLGVGALTLAAVLIYTGGAGKSAMFPLHIWLPDAMEGPTPVSALIHAATMVVAGVYLVARSFPIFAASAEALQVVMVVGAFTSLFAATIGCTQDDIKRVLAFSTLSQLGYMMFALGVASYDHPLGYTASMFHLFTHAFFKALLFLGAGSVIHAVHTNNIWQMGGLKKYMPITHGLFLLATLAIAGIPPLAGFFSKDEILAAALHSGHTGVFAVGLLVAAMTAFYMFRIYFVTFWGERRGTDPSHDHEHGHGDHGHSTPHESPAIMWVPMAVLGLLTIGAGFVPIPEWVRLVPLNGKLPEVHHGIDLAVAIPGTLAAVIGIGLAWFFYAGAPERAQGAVLKLGRLYRVIKAKFYFDEIYLFITKSIIFRLIAGPVAWFDRMVVDGLVNATGWVTRLGGTAVNAAQTGQVQTYGAWLMSGAVLAVVLLWATTRQ